MSSPVPTGRWGPALEGSGTTAGCDWGGVFLCGGEARLSWPCRSRLLPAPCPGWGTGSPGSGRAASATRNWAQAVCHSSFTPLLSSHQRARREQPPETGQGSPAHQACSGGQASRLCFRPGWAGLGGGNQLFGTEATSAGSLVSAGPAPPSQTGLGVSGRVPPSERAKGLRPRGPPPWGRDHPAQH